MTKAATPFVSFPVEKNPAPRQSQNDKAKQATTTVYLQVLGRFKDVLPQPLHLVLEEVHRHRPATHLR